MSKVRILVAEDVDLWRKFISSALLQEPAFEVICEVVDGLQAVLEAEKRQPTIALLDISLPRLSGIDAARSIGKAAPNTKIVFLSAHREVEIVQAALDLGSAYVLKSDAASDLVEAIHRVTRGEVFVSRELAKLVRTRKVKRYKREEGTIQA